MAPLMPNQSDSEQEEKKRGRYRLNPDGTIKKVEPATPSGGTGRFRLGESGQIEAVDKPGFFSRVFKTIGRTQAGPMGRLSPDEMSEAARGVSTELVSAAKGPAEELTTYDLAAARKQARALAISKGEKFKDPTIPLFTVGKRGEPRRDATARDLAGVGLLPGFYPPSGGVYEERRVGPSVREELQVPITKALFGVSATEAVHIAAERDKALRRLPPDEQLRRSPGKLAALAKFGIVPRQETELEQGRARPVEDAFALAAGFVDFFTSAEGAIVLGAGILGGPFAAVGITGFYAVESGVHAADAFDRLARSQGVDLSTVEDIDTLLKIFDNPDPDLLQEFFTSAGLTFFLTGSAPKAPRAAQLAKKKIRAAWEAYNEKYPAATLRQMVEQLMAQKKGRPSPDVYLAEGPMPKGPLFPPPAPAVVPTLETDIHKPIAEMTIEQVRRRQAQPRATDDASIAAELQHRATQLEGPTPREAARKRADEARKAPISEGQAAIAAEGVRRIPLKTHDALVEGAVRAHEAVGTLESKPETPRFQAKLDFAERKLRDALAKLRASTTLADRVRLRERVSKAKAVATEIREAIKDVDRQEAARAAIRGKEGQKIPFEDRVKVHEQLGDKFDIVSGYRSLRKMPEEGTTGRLAVEEARQEIVALLKDKYNFDAREIEHLPVFEGETVPREREIRKITKTSQVVDLPGGGHTRRFVRFERPKVEQDQIVRLVRLLYEQRPVIKTRRIQVTRKGGGPLTLARQREIFGKKLRTKLTVRELEERATQLEVRAQELEGVLAELEGGRVERGPSIDKQIARSEAELESFIGKEAMEEYRQTSRDAGLRDSEYLEAIGDLARTEKNIRAETDAQARRERPDFAKDPERGGFTIGGGFGRQAAIKEKSPIFYSYIERVVEAKMPNAAPAESIAAMLRNAGANLAELKWLDLDGWLQQKRAEGRPVSKVELQEFLRRNRLVVEETVLPRARGVSDEKLKALEAQEAEIRVSLDNETLRRNRIGFEPEHQGKISTTIANLRDQLEIVQSQRDRRINELGPTHRSDVARYERYTLPGGSNYREVLLRIPRDKVAEEGAFMLEREATYRGPHFDEPNIVAHIRLKDRTDIQGRKTLFIEELQSDWAKELRTREAVIRDTADVAALALSEDVPYQDMLALPDMPFTRDWHQLALKRVLRMAADEGYDQIAWTTGRQQMDRYDLGAIGESHIRLYDQMIPQFLSRYGKKWGAKVESTQIAVGGKVEFDIPGAARAFGKPDKFSEVHSMRITPDMKRSVLEGQRVQGGFARKGAEPIVDLSKEKPRLRKQRQGRELLEDPEAFFQRARERAVHTEVLDLEIPSGENGWIIPGRIGFIKGRFAMHDELMGRILSDDIALRGDVPPFQGEAKKVAIELKDTALEKGFVRKADTGVYEVHKFTEQTFRDLNDDLILTKWARPDQVIYIDYRTKSGRKTTFMSSAEEFAAEGFNLEKLVKKHQARYGERGFLKLDGLHKLREYFERFKAARDQRQLEENLPEVIQKVMKPEEVTRLAAHFRDNLDLATELPAIAEFLRDPNKRRVYLAIADAMTDPNFMKFKNSREFVGRLESLGTNLQEFRQWWEFSMSEWGRLGRSAEQFIEMFRDRGIDLKTVPELSWFSRAMENIRKADDVRRAALISQPATAMRNALVQIPVGLTRLTTETLAAILDRGARRIMFGELFDVLDSKGKLVQGMLTKEQAAEIVSGQKGWKVTPMEESLHQTFAHSLEIINSAFRQVGETFAHPILNQNAAKQLGFFSPQSRAVLQKFPFHVERMFAFVDPDVNIGGFGVTAAKVVRALTFFNRWQEFYFRRTFADAMLRAELKRKGVDMSQLDKIPKARLEPMVIEAVDTALRLTFAEGPQSQFGRSFLRMWDQARPLTTAFHPFVRFAMNSSKYVGRHSPARALSPYHLNKLWELMSSGKPEDVMTASRMVSETLVGSMMVAAGYLLAKSEYGGPKWNNAYDPETKEVLWDAKPFMPFGLYLFLGHMVLRAKETTQALEAADVQIGGQPMPPAEFNTRWLISMGGALTSGDTIEALTSMNRLAGSGLIFAELLFQGDRILPRDPVERERELGNLVEEFFGSFFGGYTTPLKPLKDFFAYWSPIDREFQTARTDPFWGSLVRNLPYFMQEFLGHPLPIAPSPTTGLSQPLKPQFGLPGVTARQIMPLFQQPQRDILRYEIDRLFRDRIAEYKSFYPSKTGLRVVDYMKIRYFGEFMKAQATQMVDDPAFALLDGEMRADLIKQVAKNAKAYATFRTFYEINQARQQKGLSLIPFQYIQGRAEAREARELGIGAPELTTEDIPE